MITYRRVVQIARQAYNSPTDAELQARFEGLDMPKLPEDSEWRQVISANTGKTLEPIEKWL